ncbi:ciliary microtubule associated protein 1A-like [Halichondria panicea]|uniref:ciliary microtubule associated protein 1A-like n=1 Tax=Halichondria panicea TaxID=6063 RepID=UPI00312BA4BC
MTTGDGTQTATKPKIAAMERGPGPARYCMPGLTGRSGHDVTKKIQPAYTFGKRLGISFFKKDFGPGPAHFVDPSVTRSGPEGTPRYSIGSRHKELMPFNTPGPGSYAPEQSKTCFQREKKDPSYSIGSRTKYRKRDASPSPNTYSLPTLIGPRIPNRVSSACYSLASRPKTGGFDVDYAKTPGPAGYGAQTPDLYGKKAPAYSILGRQFMPADGTLKPGPGAHSPEKSNPTRRKAPSYSLGVRHSEYLCPLIIDVSD